MDTRSTTESIEERLAVVRCIIEDGNPRETYFRIVILAKYDGIRHSFETEVSWSGRSWNLSRVKKHWRLDHHNTPLAEWIKFGSIFDNVFQLAVTHVGQVYICKSSAPDESISPARPDMLPILTAILGKISDTKPSDWTYILYDRFSGLLAEIMEDVRGAEIVADILQST
jgi:hypothetical protein